jgi:hypothetical protein
MPITLTSTGSFANMEKFLKAMKSANFRAAVEAEAEKGRQALIAATPVGSGETARAWAYKISQNRGGLTITWTNSHMAGTAPLAVLLQYGHGTGTGGYVQGRDFINPAMRPVFDRIAENIWKVVTSA